MKKYLIPSLFLMGIIFSVFLAPQAFGWSTYSPTNGYNHGWTCFPAGTRIYMADKTEKNIEDIKIGERVMGYDGKAMKPAVVLELDAPIRDHLYKLIFIDGTTLRLTSEHPIYTSEGWKSVDPQKTFEDVPNLPVKKLSIGDMVFNNKGTYTKLLSMLYIPGNVQTYNLKKVSRFNNFFADSYLAHNKVSTTAPGSSTIDCPAGGCGNGGGGGGCVPNNTCSNTCGQGARAVANGCGGIMWCPANVPCATPTPIRCTRMALGCSTRCGLPRTCVDDKCGGQSCCNATAPCVLTPTPVTTCGAGRPPCPTGQECYQPPMPPCTSGGCIQSMPQRYCRPLACPKRPQGDANCDQAINNADYDVYKSFLRGLGDDPNPHYSADFNTDGKTNLVDYEIWRSNFSH